MTENTPEPEFLRATEVAAMLRISVWQVWRMARDGELPAITVGRLYRFSKAEVLEWLEAGGSRRSAAPKGSHTPVAA